jgi:hypothetical protein
MVSKIFKIGFGMGLLLAFFIFLSWDRMWSPSFCLVEGEAHESHVFQPILSFRLKRKQSGTWRFLKSWGIPKSPWVSILNGLMTKETSTSHCWHSTFGSKASIVQLVYVCLQYLARSLVWLYQPYRDIVDISTARCVPSCMTWYDVVWLGMT